MNKVTALLTIQIYGQKFNTEHQRHKYFVLQTFLFDIVHALGGVSGVASFITTDEQLQ